MTKRTNKARAAAEKRVQAQVAAGGSAPSNRAPRPVRIPSKRSHRGAIVAALVIAVAALAAIYAVVPGMLAEESEEDVQESLLGISQDDIVSISWTHEGQQSSVELSEGTWVDAELPDAALDQTSVASIASTVASATIDRSIEADAQTEEMGLDDPTIQATIGLSDGTAVSLSIGANDDSGGFSYVSTSQSGRIFLVASSLLTALSTDMTQLYETEDTPHVSSVDSLTVTHDNQTFSLTHIEGGSDASYTTDYEWFTGSGDALEAADSDAAEVVVAAVNSLQWESCVDPLYDGTDDYGLTNPTLTARLEYTDQVQVDTGEVDDDGNAVYETQDQQKTFTLVVGKEAADGTYYAQPEGSSAVYTISAENVETLLDATAESVAPDDVCLMDWDTVESIEISYNGKTTAIDFERSEASDEDDSSDSEDTEDTTYLVDGEDADATAVESLLSAIEGLSSEGEASGAAAEDEFEITFTFVRNTETFSTMALGLTRYDNSFYLVSFNGEERLLVNRNDVAELEELVEAL